MIIPMLCVTIFVILVVWFLLPRVARLMIHTPTAISIFVCLSMVQLMAVFISMRFFFSSRRLHTRLQGDWSSDVCSSDLKHAEWQRLRERDARQGHHAGAAYEVSARTEDRVQGLQQSEQQKRHDHRQDGENGPRFLAEQVGNNKAGTGHTAYLQAAACSSNWPFSRCRVRRANSAAFGSW